MSIMSPQEICRSYYRTASIGKKALNQSDKDRLTRQMIFLEHKEHVHPQEAWELLEEIDQALWSGRLFIEEIGVTLAEWKSICARYFFETLYMHHAVPEAFGVPRVFNIVRKLEGFPENNLVLSHKNSMNSSHIPYRGIRAKVQISPGVYIELDTIVTEMIHGGRGRIKEFMERVPTTAYSKMLDIGNQSIIEA